MSIWPKDNQAARNAFYGDPGRAEIGPQMVPVVPPFSMYYDGKRIKAIQFHRKAAPSLLAALNEIWDYCGHDQAKIDAAGVSKYNGAYNPRKVRGSATKWSNHAYAAAIDLNAGDNAMGVSKGTMPQFVVDAFCRQGWMWGGWYKSRPDWMHFEAVDNGGRKPRSASPVWPDSPVVGFMSDTGEDAPTHNVPADEFEATPPAPPPPADPAVAGDPIVFSVQTRLKGRRYSPGLVDGLWGSGTSGALSGFVNDRQLRIVLPKNLQEFHAVADQIQTELTRAETEVQPDGSIGWYRPVSEARANADPKLIKELAPEVAPVKRNFFAALWAGILAFVGGIWSTVSDYVSQVWNFFTDHKDVIDGHPAVASKVWTHLAAVPVPLWLLLGAGGLAFIAYNSWRSIQTSTNAVTTGQRQ